MATSETYKTFRIRTVKNGSGKTRYQTDLGKIDGKWVRKSFKTKREAREFALARYNLEQGHGIAAKHVDQSEVEIYLEARALLKDFPAGLIEAVEYYCRHHKPTTTETSVEALVDRYIAVKAEDLRKGDIRPATLADRKSALKPFTTAFGERHIESITEAEVVSGILDGYKTVRRAAIRTGIAMFYNWLIEEKLVSVPNPITKKSSKPIRRGDIKFYTPAQTGKILRNTPSDMVPFVAIAAFAGVRTAELERLTYDDVDIANGRIVVPSAVSKTHKQRTIKMSSNLRAWLAPYAGRTGKVVPFNGTTLSANRRELFATAGVKSIKNGFRHSFATYAASKRGSSLTTVLREMGHEDSRILLGHYAGEAYADDAELYWAITPESKVIDFKAEAS